MCVNIVTTEQLSRAAEQSVCQFEGSSSVFLSWLYFSVYVVIKVFLLSILDVNALQRQR